MKSKLSLLMALAVAITVILSPSTLARGSAGHHVVVVPFLCDRSGRAEADGARSSVIHENGKLKLAFHKNAGTTNDEVYVGGRLSLFGQNGLSPLDAESIACTVRTHDSTGAVNINEPQFAIFGISPDGIEHKTRHFFLTQLPESSITQLSNGDYRVVLTQQDLADNFGLPAGSKFTAVHIYADDDGDYEIYDVSVDGIAAVFDVQHGTVDDCNIIFFNP